MDTQVMTNVMLQVPALAVVVYLVIHFLSYLKTSREEERMFVTDLVRDQSATIERGSTVIEKNSRTIHENTVVMAETQLVLRDHISKCPIMTGICRDHEEEANKA